jgi:cytochrome c oxidase cbb3-type subunit 3
MMPMTERDEFTGTPTTGHSWDGIRELNTPLPRWWLLTFYATVIWGLAYTIAYPAWPLISSATSGLLGYSSRSQVAGEIVAAKAAQGTLRDRVGAATAEEIRKNPDLLQFASAAGAAAFRVNCVQCHGSGAQGSTSYPNLNDDDWIWGGKLADIETTLLHGIRFAADPETRISDMPGFQRDAILDDKQIGDAAEYVLQLSGQEHDAAAAARGASVYADNCAACHGANGEGIHELGGPRLADGIWLYGGSREAIVAQIASPRQGVMPAWRGRLDDTTIKELAVYVHSLGGGEAPAE